MTKVKTFKKLSEWKPVSLTEALVEAEGLVGIEELSEYQILGQEPKKESGMKRKKKKQMRLKEKGWTVEEVRVGCDELDLLPWTNISVREEISKALVEQGFMTPTRIQELCIPPGVRGRRDILGAAETGSGKTLAFGIPIIQGIMQILETQGSYSDECEKRLYGLVLTPTRELAVQVRDHLFKAAKNSGVKVAALIGGLSKEKQERVLKGTPHLIVATPGRLWDLVDSAHPHLQNLENLKFLAVDETDRMVERGHFPELRALLERINQSPEEARARQNFVFSATLTYVHDLPKYLKAGKTKRRKVVKLTPEQKLSSIISLIGILNPKVVDLTTKSGIAHKLKEVKVACTLEEKDYYLFYFLNQYPGRTLVFCNSIGCVKRLASLLHLLSLSPYPLHANMLQKQRLKNLEKFSKDPKGLLLATDVAARGLDVQGIDHVLHFQVPRTAESYIHRSGRTARGEKDGLTLLLMDPSEIARYMRICCNLKRESDLKDLQVDPDLLLLVKKAVHLARDLDRVELRVRKESSVSNWLERASRDLDLHLEEDDLKGLRLGASDDGKRGTKTHLKRFKAALADALKALPTPSTTTSVPTLKNSFRLYRPPNK